MKYKCSALVLSLLLCLADKAGALVVYTENTEAQFTAGSHNSTYLTGTGSDVTLGLDYYGRAAGLSAPGSDDWFNAGWKYRLPLTASSSYSSTLSNYPVALTLNTQAEILAGRMNADGSDIRFTTAAAAGVAASLSYYIESGINTTTTKIWVKIPSIPNGANSLYLYSGNTSAAAASSLADTFIMGNNFTGADGSNPSTATLVNIESAPPQTGSLRDIQSNSLRLYFGSPFNMRYYGLRSASQYSFAAGRNYHADINARTTGADSWSAVTLCQGFDTSSYTQDDWLRFSIKHSASGATFALERSIYATKTTLASGSVGGGFHSVDVMINLSSFTVLLDGSPIYSGVNSLTFNSPYLYLEAASDSASLQAFLFDNITVQPYSSPEPAFGAPGTGQGRRYPSGTFTSQDKDIGSSGARYQSVSWASVLPSSSSVSMEVRAHDTNIALGTFTAVANGADPVVSGRHVQYRLTLATLDPRYTAAFSSITLTYGSPPLAPTGAAGATLSESSIKWSWTDTSSGQYQEDGFRVLDATGVLKGSLTSGTTDWIESSLYANTQYTRLIVGYNNAGTGSSASASKYTLPAAPNLSCDKSTATWLSGTLTCSNMAGFGPGGVGYYRYVWSSTTTSPAWAGTETQWLSGALAYLPGSSGKYFLHLKSYNPEGATPSSDATYGPFWYDKSVPGITGFSPSSSPWTNTTGETVQISLADTGGSLLKQWRYKWTTTVDRPGSAWLPGVASIINTSSSAVNINTPGSGAQWYLHTEVDDLAGNTGYLYTGPYKIDTTQPSGSININGGNTYTAQKDVTLSLTYADSESGVKEVAYRNVPGSFSPNELPQATSSWSLISGYGLKTVVYLIRDNAGNVFTSPTYPSDTIILDSTTSLQGASFSQKASGVMGETAETFSPTAILSWAPTGAPLSGKTLAFIFGGSTKTAVTDSFGEALSSFDIPTASGTYSYSVSFSTDGVYTASSATGTITATQRLTSLVTEDVNTNSFAGFIAKATLKDSYTDTLITGATITFVFEGSTKTAITNAVGVATVPYNAPGPVSFYDYSATFDGDAVYGAKNAASRVGVGLRVTSLIVPGLSPLALADFTAQATLMDGALAVANSTITFIFRGSTQTAITSAIGVASVTFTAPASSGSYSYTADFASDGTYAGSSGAGTVSVGLRPLTLAGDLVSGFVNATFQARAVLSDGITSQKVAGKTIVFMFETSSAAAVTDSNGVSTAVFSSGSLPRSSTCYYYYAGDSSYGFADSSAAVTIERRSVSLAASDTTGLLNSSFTAIAELKDTAFSPVGIAGKTITFSFLGSTQSAVTSALGIASVTFQTGISTGAYDFYISFPQDSVYVAASDTGTITLNKRPTSLTAYPAYITAMNAIKLVADLKDGITGAYISTEPVVFNYDGVSQSTNTGASSVISGRANAVYPSTGVAGTYSFYADYAGSTLYAAASSTSSITVSKRQSSLSAFPQTAILGTTFTVTAEFRDGVTNALLDAKAIRIAFSTAPLTSSLVTNSFTSGGLAVSTYATPSSTGTFSWFANFAGDSAYASASSTGTLTVNRRSAILTPIATTKKVWESIFISASFLDDGSTTPAKALSFTFMGNTLPVNTNPAAGGVATAGPFASISTPGAYGFTVSFAGDTSYSALSGSSTVTILARPSQINLGPVSAIANSTVTLTATLLDGISGTAITGSTVSFTLQGAVPYNFLAVTNASGVAASTYTAASSSGPYTFSAAFPGTTIYTGSSSSETLTVTLRPTVLEMADYYPPNNSTFTATAVLKDFATGAALGSKSVSFLFMNSTKTVTTSLGTASTTYVTLTSTISYPISASFAGDTLYAPSSISKIVFPGKRNTSLQTSDLNTAVALDSFTVTARLSDYDLGTYLVGSTITFTFNSSTGTLSTKTAYTNSTGAAGVQFTAPVSTGNYTYTATFPGNTLYNGTLNTSAILVNRRTPVIEPSDLTGIPASSTFTASALLRDNALTLSTRTISFTFLATKTAQTNGIGVASTTFPAPVSTGTFIYSAAFGGDALYNSATAYASVGVILKPTVLEVVDVPDAVVGLKFKATAKLRDIELGNALVLSTKTIRIIFTTGTVNAVTIGGVSTAAFIAPPTVGTYGYTAEFFGDSVYGPSTSSGTVTVNRRPVLFGLATDPNQPYAYRANSVNSSFTITATLSDGQVAGLNLSTKTVRFSFLGVEKTAVTDLLGMASVTYASPASSGTYPYYGYFDGDVSYNPNNPDDSNRSLNIIPRGTYILPAAMATGNLVPDYIHTFFDYSLSATIIDSLSGQGIGALPLQFYILNSSRTGITNSVNPIGTASSSLNFPYIESIGSFRINPVGTGWQGVYPASVAFAGDGTYAASLLPSSTDYTNNTTGKLRVLLTPARIGMTDIQEVYPDMDVTVSGTAYDYWSRTWARDKLKGKQVWYRLSSTPCTMPTCAEARTWGAPAYSNIDDSFVATATLHTPLAAGDYPVDVWFSNDTSFYQWRPAENQRILRVGRRLTFIIPDSEPFTVGAQKPIDLTLKLADATQSFIGINGKSLEVVLVTTQTLTTGSAGPAGKVKPTFAGLAVGTYTYIARFADGDPTYSPYVTTGTVIVEKNLTTLAAEDVLNVPAGNNFIAKATLNISSGGTNTPLPGKAVNFVFTTTGPAQINLSAVTNAIGVATVTYWSPYVPASYNYTAEFLEDADNKGSTDNTNSVQVIKRRTQTTALNAAVYILENFVSTATLVDLDLNNSTIPAKTISFLLHGPETAKTAVTSSIGLASATYASPASSGAYQYSATYASESYYELSSDTRTVTVSRRVTAIDIVDLTTPTMSALTLSATLSDITFSLGVSTPLAKQVKFVFNGVTQYATAGADGIASSAFTAPTAAASYLYSATFTGDTTYNSVASTRTVTVRKTNTITTGTDVNAPSGAQFTAQAMLIDEFGKKLNGFPIGFVFTGTTTYNGSGTTDSNGTTTALFTAPLSTGIYIYTSSFAGDASYGASSINNNVSVLKASSTLSVPDGTIVVNKVYYATATLNGLISGAGVPLKNINFTFSGTPNGLLGNAQTDINGVAVYPFTPTSTGTYRLDADYPGDTSFYASAASGTVVVTRRVSGIALTQPVNAEVFANFIATATLTDFTAGGGTAVAGRTVDFLFNGGNAKSAVTNSLGVATVTYTAPGPGGTTYPVAASFAGDDIFQSTNTAGLANVAKRVTGITVDAGSVTALEVFNATATLRWNGAPVTGKVIWFAYQGGSSIAGPATDINGQSFLQFNAGASSGPWRLDGAFINAADSDYTIASGSGAITVLRRSCLVRPDNIAMSVFDTFTATATFMDVANSSTPAGKYPKFAFNWILASSFTVLTPSDSAGKVYISSGAPASSGTYKVEGFYPGDATYLPSLTSTATVTVSRRPSQLTVDNAAVIVDKVFTATATLRNNGALLGDKYVLFTFEGKNFNSRTGIGGSLGVAVATFTVTISTGPNQIDAVFSGDSSYDASNAATATVTAAMRPTFITPQTATAVVNKRFISSATLSDIYGMTVATKTLAFLFNGFTISSVTSGVGLATAAFTADVATGPYSIPVSFAGDYKYMSSSTTLSLTVTRRSTSLTSGGAVTVNALDVFYATSTLKDVDSINLPTKPLRFVFQGSTFTKATDGSGVSVTTFTAPAANGAYNLAVYFDDGDPAYSPSSLVIPVTVQRRPSAISLNSISGTALDLFKTTATLTDPNNGALQVSSRTVTFSFSWSGTPSTSAVTNAVGVASAAYNATAAAGSYTLTASMPSDATYASTQTTTAFPVYKRNGFIIGVFVSTRVLDTFTVNATFYDSVTTLPVANRNIKFSLQNIVTTQTVATGALGTAGASFTAPAASGTYAIAIWTDTDPTYNDTSVYMSSVTLARRSSYINLAGPSNIIINSTFTPSGTMFDSVSNSTVPSKTLSFLFQASTNTALTNGLGLAATGYTASPSSGTYGLQVSFAGDATYNSSFSSKTLTAQRYPTSIAGPAIAVTMNEVLTATATLRDYLSATVGSKPLVFYFTNSSFTWITSGAGVAYSTYAASVASGTYSLPVSFAGDALYESTSTSLSLLVNKRTPLLSVAPVTVKTLDIFTATSTLTDARVPAQKLSGQTVVFNFLEGGNTYINSGVTDLNGIATSTFTAPASSGTYQVNSYFVGDSSYYPVSVSGSVTVVPRPVRLMLDNAAADIDVVFRTTATLVDTATSLAVATKTITFTFGSSSAAVTGINGKASVTFTAASSSGSFQMNSIFSGNATYITASSTATLLVSRRPTVVTGPNISGIIDEIFTATAAVTDGLNSANISGSNVGFVFSGSTFTALTSAGVAVSTFAAPPSSGTYYVALNFIGDARNLPAGTTVQLSVDRRLSAIQPDPVSTRAGEIFTATASLRDVANPAYKPAGLPLKFIFYGSTFTALTDANGLAVSTFTAPLSSGTLRLDLSFDGDSRYKASSSSGTVTVLRRPSAISLDPATIQAIEVFTATATLTDKINPFALVNARMLAFTFSGKNFNAPTDAGGVAVSTFMSPVSSGTYLIEANFPGDALYENSYASGTVLVTQRPAGITVADSSAYPFEDFAASGLMKDGATGLPVAGRALQFTLDGTTASAVTNGIGVATAPYTPPGAFGGYELAVNFDGDGTYAAYAATGTVSVMRRPTAISTLDFPAIALDVFIASATISDIRLSSNVAGENIVFIFGTQSSTAAADASGHAWAQFSAPVASGTYFYTAVFNGSPVYEISSATGAITVGTRATRVVARDANANVGEPFTLTAQLLDPAKEDLPGYYVSNVPLKITFKDRNNIKIDEGTAMTNELGIASITFSGPGAPDVYYYTAAFEGDVTYSSSTATAMLKVGLLTSLVAFDAETMAMETFPVKAKLTDYLSTTLDDVPIRFKFLGNTSMGLTYASGVSGVAEGSFTAPASSGTYYYNAYFDGDSVYSASNATGTITVKLRRAYIQAPAVNTLTNSTFTATITLKDVGNDANIGGRNVDIYFNGSTSTLVTDIVTGQASASFFVASSGTYYYGTAFNGDATYSGAVTTGTVNVNLKPTNMLSYSITNIVANSTFTAQVQIKDNFNQPVKDLGVDFDFKGSFNMGLTNSLGIAEAVFTAPASSGVYTYHAVFYGDSQYDGSAADGTVSVGPRPTITFTSAVSAKLGMPLELSAKLVDVKDQAGIPGQPLNFYFGGSTQTAVTDSLGISSATFAAPPSTGSYYYEAAFNGDEVTYMGSTSSASITVALNFTSLDARSGIALKIREPLQVEATLKDSIGLQLAGLPVTLNFEGTDAVSITDSFGKATATFSTVGLVSTGTYNYTASYLGDTVYVASVDTYNVVNISRRDSLLIARDATTPPSKSFLAEARFYDNVNASVFTGAPIAGKTIVFELHYSTFTAQKSAVTSALGVSTINFLSPVSTGTFLLTARFADDDAIYNGALSTAAITVLLDDGTGALKTKVVVESVTSYLNKVFTASGTLTATDVPVSDKPVLFEFFNGIATYTAAGFTNSSGLAVSTFAAPASSGTYYITASFSGDIDFSAATGTATLTANRYPDSLAAQAVVAFVGEDFRAKAVLRDELTQAFVAGKTISFEYFNGISTITKTAVTSSTGSAETNFTAPALLGNYSYTARFAGDTLYEATTDIASVLIAAKGSSTFLVSYDVFIGTGEVFAASATITSKGLPVQGKAVKITFQGLTRFSTSSVQGLVFSTFTAPASSGTFTYEAEFIGDIDYNAALTTASVSVVFRKPIEQPVFKVEVTSSTVIFSLPKSSGTATFTIEESASLRGVTTSSASVAASTGTTGYTAQIDPDKATFIKVKKKLDDNQEGQATLVVEIPSKAEDPERVPNYYYMSKEENNWAAWVKIPGKVMDKVGTADFSMEVKKDVNPDFLAAYTITSSGASADLASDLKASNKNGVRLTIAYPQAGAVASAASGQLAIYWFNGIEWIKLGGEIDVLTGEIYTYSRVLGQFAIRAAPLASVFTVTKVAPRIFSPDEPDPLVNRARFYFENPGGGEVTIRIFDITGALVRRNLESEGSNIMFWNGKDQAGVLVKGGVYIYQIEATDKVITGTVVVAK